MAKRELNLMQFLRRPRWTIVVQSNALLPPAGSKYDPLKTLLALDAADVADHIRREFWHFQVAWVRYPASSVTASTTLERLQSGVSVGTANTEQASLDALPPDRTQRHARPMALDRYCSILPNPPLVTAICLDRRLSWHDESIHSHALVV